MDGSICIEPGADAETYRQEDFLLGLFFLTKRREGEKKRMEGERRVMRGVNVIYFGRLGCTPLGVYAECVETVRMGGEEEEKVREEKKK